MSRETTKTSGEVDLQQLEFQAYEGPCLKTYVYVLTDYSYLLYYNSSYWQAKEIPENSYVHFLSNVRFILHDVSSLIN